MLKSINKTARGFINYDFADDYNNERIENPWYIRKCSHATSDCFWLSIGEQIIHLDQTDMAHIVDIFSPYLNNNE